MKQVTRPFVPFLLNSRVYRYMFAPWQNEKCCDQITIEIPMKYYPKDGGGKWVVRQMYCTFVKREFTIGNISLRPQNAQPHKKVLLVSPEEVTVVTEVAYVCRSLDMYYDNENLPVARA